jgi:hypothetical protein
VPRARHVRRHGLAARFSIAHHERSFPGHSGRRRLLRRRYGWGGIAHLRERCGDVVRAIRLSVLLQRWWGEVMLALTSTADEENTKSEENEPAKDTRDDATYRTTRESGMG